jgi:hypothetical protein
MLNFPIPYQDELIYSTIARYGVHFGITSPKQLLDEVFENRQVIATTDLPCHLSAISKHINNKQQNSTEDLAYQHTLFPLYAPFVQEERRLECLRLMKGGSQGAIHLALGVAASRIKQELSLRYCPQCMQLQRQQHGEYYWRRLWQISGADVCPLHGELKQANVERHSYHRHEFFAPSPENCPNTLQQQTQECSQLVTNQVEKLLNRPCSKSASLAQWTAYYRYLAVINGYDKGQFVKHEEIRQRVLDCWPVKWLTEHALDIDDSQNSWLRLMFRKHRKSFSYLEHLVVLQSFLSEPWDINDVLDKVSLMPINTNPPISKSSSSEIGTQTQDNKLQNIDLNHKHRKNWQTLVKKHGVKPARKQLQGGAIYAWLYRHDKPWLLEFNSQYRIYPRPINNRVNWQKKDKQTVRQLIKIRNHFEKQLALPRMSRNWYLSQIASPSTIEKNLHKLPLCGQFFLLNSEGITEYQIRRITRVVALLDMPLVKLSRWKVIRMAGLSEERLRKGSNEFLTKIIQI